VRNNVRVGNEDEFSFEPSGLFSESGARIETEDGGAMIVRKDRTTGLTTLDLEDSEGVLLGSRVLGGDDLERLHDSLKAAQEHAREFDVPVAVDVSTVIGRD
jgi:hypothetical protein